MVSCVVVSLHIALAAVRRPLGNANPFLGEGAREGRSTVRVEAAERGEPQIEQKGQGETGVNSNEPNLAEGERGRAALELQTRPPQLPRRISINLSPKMKFYSA